MKRVVNNQLPGHLKDRQLIRDSTTFDIVVVPVTFLCISPTRVAAIESEEALVVSLDIAKAFHGVWHLYRSYHRTDFQREGHFDRQFLVRAEHTSRCRRCMLGHYAHQC